MKTNHFLLLAIMLLLSAANAATLAVLEITLATDDDEIGLTVNETRFLTDELRRQAIRILPKDYSVLTREKIISLVPQTAENLNSVIDIGMVIKSDYVTHGLIGKLGNLFTLTIELYETSSGNLLGDFVKESTDLKGLLDAIRENAPNLFTKLIPETVSEPQQPTYKAGLRLGVQPETANDTQSVATPIPTNIPAEPKKSKTSFWVAIGLDALGAAALGLGVYNYSKAKSYYKDSQDLLKDVPNSNKYPEEYEKRESDFAAKYKKMQDTQMLRNIFYATGGALLSAGLAVHIWF